MGNAFMMSRLLLFAAVLVAISYSLEDSGTIRELGDEQPTYGNGGADTHPPATAGGQGTGYFNTENNFPGPKHGLPGYKESHNWEEDIDLMSPLVFDYRMYRALIQEKVADATG